MDKKLVFGDPDSIAYKKKFEEDKLKENAILVNTISEEIYHEPEYEYDFKCPKCGCEENGVHQDDIEYDNIWKCNECGQFLKLNTN